MAQGLGMFAEDLNSVPSTEWQLAIVCNFSSGESNALCPLWVHSTHKLIQARKHIHKYR